MARNLWLVVFMAAALAACGGSRGGTDDDTNVGGDGDEFNLGDGDGDDGQVGDGDGGGDSTVGDDDLPTGVELNVGWIGGACQSANDCTSAAFSQPAVCETTGFTNGMCTQPCTQGGSGSYICPDESVGPTTDFTTTRCVEDDAGAPRCVSECDFNKSPTGCRPGYTCVLQQRYGTSTDDRIYPVCLPSDVQRWPGQSAPAFDIGGPCSNGVDCNHLSCLKVAGGYCTKLMCDLAGCPAGSSCVQFGDDESFTACLRNCTSDTQCRTAEDHSCLPDYNLCWYEPTPPPHDPSVGTADCAAAWGTDGDGLSPCDTTPDDYVVVNKTARNIAVCSAGAVVQNYNIGLGFAPTGDKQVEGDGKTPEGVFYIPRKINPSEYYKAFLLSYPDKADATWGLSNGKISQSQKDAIDAAQDGCTEPPQNTGLGGLIEIHGQHVANTGGDWTWGCIATENAVVDQLWGLLDIGDTIVVKP